MFKNPRTNFRKIVETVIRGIQKILILLLLIVIYFLGFGITAILMVIFGRRFFPDCSYSGNTFWINAKDYEFNPEEVTRQS